MSIPRSRRCGTWLPRLARGLLRSKQTTPETTAQSKRPKRSYSIWSGEHYQRRDRLRLIVDHRRKYLKVLIVSGEEEAAQVADRLSESQSAVGRKLRRSGESGGQQKGTERRRGKPSSRRSGKSSFVSIILIALPERRTPSIHTRS